MSTKPMRQVSCNGRTAVDEDYEFWMDAKPTKKDAVALCRHMGWRVSS
jgi:hypothetical protein